MNFLKGRSVETFSLVLLQAAIRLLFAVRSRFRASFRNPLHLVDGIASAGTTLGRVAPFVSLFCFRPIDSLAPFKLLAGSVRLRPLACLMSFAALAPRNCLLEKMGLQA